MSGAIDKRAHRCAADGCGWPIKAVITHPQIKRTFTLCRRHADVFLRAGSVPLGQWESGYRSCERDKRG